MVLKPSASASGEELRAFLAPHFPKFWLPDAFEFIDAIRNQRPCVPSFHDGARAQAVMDAGHRSAALQAWVEV